MKYSNERRFTSRNRYRIAVQGQWRRTNQNNHENHLKYNNPIRSQARLQTHLPGTIANRIKHRSKITDWMLYDIYRNEES